MNLADIEKYEKVKMQLNQLHQEMGILAKSKPDNPVNKFKLKIINEKLGEANSILVGKFKPVASFDTFCEDDLSTNSDVVIILSQYLDSLEGWRSANVVYSERENGWYWNTDGELQVHAISPTRFSQASSRNIKSTRGQTK